MCSSSAFLFCVSFQRKKGGIEEGRFKKKKKVKCQHQNVHLLCWEFRGVAQGILDNMK